MVLAFFGGYTQFVVVVVKIRICVIVDSFEGNTYSNDNCQHMLCAMQIFMFPLNSTVVDLLMMFVMFFFEILETNLVFHL